LRIEKLIIENLRNISNAEISPHKKINIIHGSNGAGKTTLLEAIYILARARSFRQKNSDPLIKEGTEKLNLFTILHTAKNTKHQIGLQKSNKKTEIRKDGKNLRKLSDLAKSIPLTIITPNIQRIIEEDPKHRRRLLNWGLFHVEPEYGELANRYKKILVQRNKALRVSPAQINVWDRQLISIGDEIYSSMEKYSEIWNETLNSIVKSTQIIKPIHLNIKKGWKEGETFADALERNRKTDQERGFTSCGPHRSDVRLIQDGKMIKNTFSRGEAKIAAVFMLLSQTKMLADRLGEYPILLADDLHSELDYLRYNTLLTLIDELNLQSFITTLEFDNKQQSIATDAYQVFHVEHGELSEAFL
jgi:DNA replication and repair protein RecF